MKFSRVYAAIVIAYSTAISAHAGVMMCSLSSPSGNGLATQQDMEYLHSGPATSSGTTMASYTTGTGDASNPSGGQGPLGFIAGATTSTSCPSGSVSVGYAATASELQSMITSAINNGGADSGNPNAVIYNNGGTPSNPNTVTVANGVNGTDAANMNQLNSGIASAVSSANDYTNTQVAGAVTTANNYTNSVAAQTLNQANAYTDEKTKYFAANSTLAAASATGQDSLAMGPAALSSGDRAVAAGAHSTASGADSVAIGSSANSVGASSVAIGNGSSSTGANSVAMGAGTSAGGTNSVALGAGSSAAGVNAVAMGSGSAATGANSIAIGTGNKVSGNGSGAIGDPSTVSGNGSYSLGNNNTVAQDNTFVVGNGVTTTQANSVVLGNGSTDRAATTETGAQINGSSYTFAGQGSAAAGVVSVGAAGAERQVINVAAGALSSTSTDAVNGSQLYATNQAVNHLGQVATTQGQSAASIFGGGATYNPATGQITAPTYTVNNTQYNNVGSAIGALGSTITQNNSDQRPAASATGANSVAVGSGSNATRDNTVDFGGRQLTGLANGTQDGDASTMGQLRQATADTKSYTDRAVASLDARSQKMMSGIGAMAMAASALQPNGRAEGSKSVGAAMGTYNGESALAVGVNWYISNQILLNAKVSYTSSGPGKVGAAVGLNWGF